MDQGMTARGDGAGFAPSVALATVAALLDCESSEQFSVSLARLLPKLGRHLEAARRIGDVRDVSAADVRAWVNAPLPGGVMPSVATRHNRRSAARLGFRLLREAGVVDHDPTLDLVLPPRSRGREARPLTDEEIELGRAATRRTLGETRRPGLWALAEATATTHEIPRIHARQVDLGQGTVFLPGSSKIIPRWANLTDWGIDALERRLCELGSADRPLLYEGAGTSPSSMQAASAMTLTKILTQAGLRHDPAVMPASVRAWAGDRVFRATGRIEKAAVALGCHTLDTAAAIIGFDWHDLR